MSPALAPITSPFDEQAPLHGRLVRGAPMSLARDHAAPRRRVVRYRSVASFLADYDRNLSRGRVFLNTRALLRVGAHVQLELALDRWPMRARVTGCVTEVTRFGNAVNAAPGMRVSIGDSADVRRLRAFATRVRALDAGPGSALRRMRSSR